MTGPGLELFDHIAECLSNFVHDRDLQNDILPLGFTFSFPLEQQVIILRAGLKYHEIFFDYLLPLYPKKVKKKLDMLKFRIFFAIYLHYDGFDFHLHAFQYAMLICYFFKEN